MNKVSISFPCLISFGLALHRLRRRNEVAKLIFIITSILLAFGLDGSAQTNIIEDQTNWPFGDYVNSSATNPQTNNLPQSSYWCSGTSSIFNGTNGTLVCAPISAGSSFTCWTYYAPSNAPVALSPGHTLQMTLNFMDYGTGPENSSRGLRMGLLYSGANQTTNSGTAPGANIVGYVQQMNYGAIFSEAPLQTDADTNQNQIGSLFSSDSVFAKIGSNGGGNTNDNGFADGVPYTMVMSIGEKNPNSINITTTFIGSTLTNGMITQTVTDTNYCYTNFDTFCFRPAAGDEAATNFTFTSFEVQTFPTPASGSFVASVQDFPTNTIVLSWNSTQGSTYTIYRTNNITAPLSNWTQIITGFPSGSAPGGTIYYTDRPAGSLEFYKISSP